MGDTWESYRLKNLSKKSCYIAGKIKDCNNFIELFEQGKVEVQKLGMVPISPLELAGDITKLFRHNPTEQELYDEFMKIDITILIRCANIYVLDNWQISKGATMELSIAKFLHLNIFYQAEERMKLL